MSTTTRPRPRSLPSTTTKLQTEYGNGSTSLVSYETSDGEPFEVFGWLGKGGSFQHGVTELACRLISLHMRRGTPLEEVIDQCQGIQPRCSRSSTPCPTAGAWPSWDSATG